MVDAVSATALVVSFIAFLVAIMQVTQQYAATAYDYRKCSKKTIGAWAKHTHRKWIWSEVRFEITFSTPRITLAPRPSPYTSPFPSLDEDHVEPSYQKRQYCYVHQDTSRRKDKEWYDLNAKPWFLRATGTIPEAKCSWVSLLQATALSDLSFTLSSRASSYDYVPDGISRPLASMDQRSFLTLMSLYRINWRDRGSDAIFAGASDLAEVTTREITNFGRTYHFNPRETDHSEFILNDTDPQEAGVKYYITSERARAAMFNCFQLGFATLLTHTSDEVASSLKDANVDDDAAEYVGGCYSANGGWSPGLAEAVASWGYASMPKCIDEKNDTFKSIFSAIPTVASFGDPPIIAMLCNDNIGDIGTPSSDPSNLPIWEISTWARKYFSSRPHIRDLVLPQLRWASQLGSANVCHLTVPWHKALDALPGIVALDEELDKHLLRHLDHDGCRQFKLDMLDAQVKYQCRIFPDASAAAGEGRHWMEKIDLIAAQNGHKIVDDIKGYFENSEQRAREVLMNRWMRGVLWVIHNGNPPEKGIRELECSLSSRWLYDTTTIYVA
ncbi:hypothetical protein SISSUDRAFT_990080 [Sistotremastrum suecicum HHB10207 ss-3]|uniref:Uncharacterized protein n=1 Tax=Sistotremastrum suecicum HHB10207 ss-3 TaxID=1314776 RepID=A0A166AXG3_9AGAM|nr:hypothetical protein SISSUDRAFT_990080 [Sistotremastrum suecicum HHB10207 ss-3]